MIQHLNQQKGFGKPDSVPLEREVDPYKEIENASQTRVISTVEINGKILIGRELVGNDYLTFNYHKETDGNSDRASKWLFFQFFPWVWIPKHPNEILSPNSEVRKTVIQDWKELSAFERDAFTMSKMSQDIICNDDQIFEDSADFSVFVNASVQESDNTEQPISVQESEESNNTEQSINTQLERRITIRSGSASLLTAYQSEAQRNLSAALKKVIKMGFLVDGKLITDDDFENTVQQDGIGFEVVAACATRFTLTLKGGKFKGGGKVLRFPPRPTLSGS